MSWAQMSQLRQNASCWTKDYTYDMCCLGQHPDCWDSIFTFERCCEHDAHARPFRQYAYLANNWRLGLFTDGAVAGTGATIEHARPFAYFLVAWLLAHAGGDGPASLGGSPGVSSMVEASAGHWPTGWQREVSWPPLDYVGIDILPELVMDNLAFIHGHGGLGLKTTKFEVGDMLRAPLPPADLLLTKDTLIHFPNSGIQEFLRRSVTVCPARFRYVMFVHDQMDPEGPQAEINNIDVGGKLHDHAPYHPLDLAAGPFWLPVRTIFVWGKQRKAVQLWSAPEPCHPP